MLVSLDVTRSQKRDGPLRPRGTPKGSTQKSISYLHTESFQSMAYQLERTPCRRMLVDLEQHQLRRPERVDILQRHRRDDRRDERAPHHVAVRRKGIELLQPEQHAAQRAAKRDRHTRGGRCC